MINLPYVHWRDDRTASLLIVCSIFATNFVGYILQLCFLSQVMFETNKTGNFQGFCFIKV